MSTTYWDTSAVIAAIEDQAIRGRFQSGKHITRSHTLGEVFSTLTGGRYQPQYSPNDAAALVDAVASDLKFVDLEPGEVIAALKKAGKVAVRGARVHDYLHAVAAEKGKADTVLTLNLAHFDGLERGFTLEEP